MHQINLKPLSVNTLYRGRRYKTKEYEAYEKEVLYALPKGVTIPVGPLALRIIAGLSNKRADLSNTIKAFEDIMQKKWGFDDNRVYRISMEKKIVPKGKEYIAFEITGAYACTCTFPKLRSMGYPESGVTHGKDCNVFYEQAGGNTVRVY